MSVDLVPIPDEILDEDEQTTPRLETVIDRYVQAGIAGVRVAVAGVAATDIDTTSSTISVRPVMRDIYPDGSALPEEIANVPVYFPSSSSGALTMPVRRGDPVMIIFCDRDLRRWIREGSSSNTDIEAQDRRRHSYGGTWCMPGIEPRALRRAVIASDRVRMGNENVSVEVTDSNNVRIGSGAVDLLEEVGNLLDETRDVATQLSSAATSITTVNTAYNTAYITAYPPGPPPVANPVQNLAILTAFNVAVLAQNVTLATIQAALTTIQANLTAIETRLDSITE